ncbi:MAG: ABC transporter permease [Clostridia bacterium]|nr:ABC transporter permease [Clostridia bacterium]
MIKLLRANMARLVKSATFWIFICAYVIYSIAIPVYVKIDSAEYTSEEWLLNLSMKTLAMGYGIAGASAPAFVVAIVCAIFFGCEFQNGTLKNKFSIGYTRSQIYVANLLTACILSFALLATYLIIFSMLGLPMLGKINSPTKDVAMLFLKGSIMLIAYSSLFTMITMTSKNPIAALILSVGLVFASFLLMMYFDTVMNRPQFFYEQKEIFGIHYFEPIPNPNYPSQSKLNFFHFMIDFLPTGQCYSISYKLDFSWQQIAYSLGWIAVTNCSGMLIFHKSPIK